MSYGGQAESLEKGLRVQQKTPREAGLFVEQGSLLLLFFVLPNLRAFVIALDSSSFFLFSTIPFFQHSIIPVFHHSILQCISIASWCLIIAT